MRSDTASATALLMCAYRARVSSRPSPLVVDPWAAALAGEDGARLARELDPVYPHMELWTAVRTHYIDAKVSRYTSPPWSFARVVLLGAGLDTRASRLSRAGVRFFEVDHPDTQADKRRRVSALDGYPLDAASYISCDFETDDLATRLGEGGVDASEPALVVWEGVTPYLPEAAVRATLRAIAAALHPRSVVVFDHLLKKQADPNNPATADHAQGFVRRLGEPVRFGTNDPVPLLYEEGFRHVRSVSFDEACLTLTGTYERERQFRFQRIVTASVTPPPHPHA